MTFNPHLKFFQLLLLRGFHRWLFDILHKKTCKDLLVPTCVHFEKTWRKKCFYRKWIYDHLITSLECSTTELQVTLKSKAIHLSSDKTTHYNDDDDDYYYYHHHPTIQGHEPYLNPSPSILRNKQTVFQKMYFCISYSIQSVRMYGMTMWCLTKQV